MSNANSATMTMTNDEFRAIVDADIRNQSSEEQYEWLRTDPQAVDRWYTTLTSMKKSVENQFASKNAETKALRAELEARGDHDGAKQELINYLRWKAGVVRFKTGLEEKLSDAAWRRRQLTGVGTADFLRAERNRLSNDVDVLTDAVNTLISLIEAHKDGLDDGDTFSKADLQLWEAGAEMKKRIAYLG